MPPLTGVAVKVTDVPEQIVVALGEILTEGVTLGFTTIAMALLVAEVVAAHEALLRSSQVTDCPFVRLVVV